MSVAPPETPIEDDAATPLVVDVDGALVADDLFIEGAARLIARCPLKVLALPFWLLRGRAALKRRVAEAVPLPTSTLVLNPVVLREIAIAKRQTELASAEGADGRAYHAGDGPAMAALGAGSGFATVVVLTLYIQSPEVSARYPQHELLWLVCPLLVHRLGRLTLLAGRGAVHDDPVVFAMRDRTSWLTGLAIAAAVLAALREP